MPSLAEFQAGMRGAIVDGAKAQLAEMLEGGRDPARRLAIHQRHYEASLVRALTEKFPAAVWLAGSEFITEAARLFVHRNPPGAPCIAEYGQSFPAFLASCPGAERVPALRSVAELDWRLGHAALALEHPPVTIEAAASIDPERLTDCVLQLQPGLRYLAASWPVDDLMTLFLSEAPPQQYALEPEDVWLEIRGARGAFSITRLDAGPFVFRRQIAAGASIGNAAEQAAEADPAFDAGTALAAMLTAGLVTAIDQQEEGELR